MCCCILPFFKSANFRLIFKNLKFLLHLTLYISCKLQTFFNTGSILMFIIASLYKFPSIHTYTKRSVQRWVILEEEDHDHASAWLRKELSQKTRTELECIRHHTSASSHIGYRDCQPALLVLPMLLLKRLCAHQSIHSRVNPYWEEKNNDVNHWQWNPSICRHFWILLS